VPVRFSPKTPRKLLAFRVFAALRRPLSPHRLVSCVVPLAALCCSAPSLAQDLDARNLDLALHGHEAPVGELSANAEFSGVSFAARHSEYLGFLNQALQDDGGDNPLLRSTEIEARGVLGLGTGADLPLGLAMAHDQWDAGEHDLHITARSGLHLDHLWLDHRLTMTTSFAADGGETRSGSGEMRLGTALFGGVQEGVIGYDALPQAQITVLGFSSDWSFEAGSSALAGFSHRPLDGVSEARFGFQQRIGPFEVISDLAADSEGAYRIGIGFSLDLGRAPEAVSWRLSSLLTALQDEGQPPLAPVPHSLLSGVD